jgi:Effector Associated Constant Component 1
MQSPTVDVVITPQSYRYDDDDERWIEQVADLRRDLHSEAGLLFRPPAAVSPGTKGPVDEVILALGSAGAFTATLDMLRAWLNRDKTRTVRASWLADDGRRQELVLSAENAAPETLAPLVEALASKLGDGL